MKPEIKILIADDHPIFRAGLRQVIERDARIKVVAEADDGQAALEALPGSGADVAILDVDMPGMDGFQVAQAIREKRMAVEVIILTMHKDERFLNAALDLGVKGYLVKDSAAADVINCIRAVADGREFVSPQLTGLLLKRSRGAASLLEQKPSLESLSPAERRVLRLVGEYKTSKEIADILCLSVRTIEFHRARICEKLELKGAHALIKFAVKHHSEL
jgi:DNA-binding NarL/FixJ family response regulator